MPEPWQPSYQWKMPIVPPPEDFELEEDRFTRLLASGEFASNPKAKAFYEGFRYVTFCIVSFFPVAEI